MTRQERSIVAPSRSGALSAGARITACRDGGAAARRERHRLFPAARQLRARARFAAAASGP
jgi:hypothetical protein